MIGFLSANRNSKNAGKETAVRVGPRYEVENYGVTAILGFFLVLGRIFVPAKIGHLKPSVILDMTDIRKKANILPVSR